MLTFIDVLSQRARLNEPASVVALAGPVRIRGAAVTTPLSLAREDEAGHQAQSFPVERTKPRAG